MNRRSQRLGNPQEGLDGNDFLSALDFSQVFGIEFGFFGQRFLGEMIPPPVKANRIANHPPMSQDDFPLPGPLRFSGLGHNFARLAEGMRKLHQLYAGILVFDNFPLDGLSETRLNGAA